MHVEIQEMPEHQKELEHLTGSFEHQTPHVQAFDVELDGSDLLRRMKRTVAATHNVTVTEHFRGLLAMESEHHEARTRAAEYLLEVEVLAPGVEDDWDDTDYQRDQNSLVRGW